MQVWAHRVHNPYPLPDGEGEGRWKDPLLKHPSPCGDIQAALKHWDLWEQNSLTGGGPLSYLANGFPHFLTPFLPTAC